MKSQSVILNSIMPIIGVGMLIIAFFNYQENTQLNISQGVVVRLSTSSGYRSTGSYTRYQPVVEFTDDKGKQIQFLAPTFSSPSKYSMNEKVQVVYRPESPIDAKIQSSFSLWLGVILSGVFGVLAFVIGGFVIVDSVKRK